MLAGNNSNRVFFIPFSWYNMYKKQAQGSLCTKVVFYISNELPGNLVV